MAPFPLVPAPRPVSENGVLDKTKINITSSHGNWRKHVSCKPTTTHDHSIKRSQDYWFFVSSSPVPIEASPRSRTACHPHPSMIHDGKDAQPGLNVRPGHFHGERCSRSSHIRGTQSERKKKASECQCRLKWVHDAQLALNVRPGHFHGERCSRSLAKEKTLHASGTRSERNQVSASADWSDFTTHNGV